MDLLLLIFCCVRNYARAKAKGLNAAGWAGRTLLAMLLCMIVGWMIVIFIQLSKHPELKALTMNTTDRTKLTEAMMQYYVTPVNMVFVLVCELGGYLLVRHRLMRYSDRQSDNDEYN